jgi:hypothetical protein
MIRLRERQASIWIRSSRKRSQDEVMRVSRCRGRVASGPPKPCRSILPQLWRSPSKSDRLGRLPCCVRFCYNSCGSQAHLLCVFVYSGRSLVPQGPSRRPILAPTSLGTSSAGTVGSSCQNSLQLPFDISSCYYPFVPHSAAAREAGAYHTYHSTRSLLPLVLEQRRHLA